MNQVIVLGCVTHIDETKKMFYLSIPRSKYTNDKIINDTFICKGCNLLHRNITSFIKVNDQLLLKGRIQEDDGKYYILVESYQIIQRKV